MENDEKCLSLNAGGSRRPTGDSAPVWEPVITQSETLPERKARESSSREERGGGRGTLRMLRCPCGLLRARNARRSNKKKGAHKRGPWIVKAASHKHPHNDLCDERPFGDFFLPPPPPPHFLIPAVTMRTCIYFLRPLFLSPHIMHRAFLFLSPFILRTVPLCFVSSSSLFFFPIPRRSSLSFSRASSFPFLFSPPRNSSRYIFSAGKHAGTRRAQLGSLY